MSNEAATPESAVVGVYGFGCGFADATKVADVCVVLEEGGYVLGCLRLNVSSLVMDMDSTYLLRLEEY